MVKQSKVIDDCDDARMKSGRTVAEERRFCLVRTNLSTGGSGLRRACLGFTPADTGKWPMARRRWKNVCRVYIHHYHHYVREARRTQPHCQGSSSSRQDSEHKTTTTHPLTHSTTPAAATKKGPRLLAQQRVTTEIDYQSPLPYELNSQRRYIHTPDGVQGGNAT